MSIVLFNLIALILIAFIIGWFWLIKDKATDIQQDMITIEVKDGIYAPNRIKVHRPKVTLNFIRKDPSPCSEYVVFQNLDVHEQLPLNKPYKIVLDNLKNGEYKFTCQMNMYQGELVVELG